MTTHRTDLPSLFARVMDARPDDRDQLIGELLADDAELRRELVRLVAAASSPSGDNDPLSDRAIASRRERLESTGSSGETIQPGTALAGYTIERLLGQGGMGAVYLAKQRSPDRYVALKVLRSGFPSEKSLKRFEIEAETLGRLRHAGIAQVFEAGVHAGQPFFAMEFIDGEPINHYVRRASLATADILRLAAKVAAALQHAHQRGVIHRDLKPANILVVDAGDGSPPEPKILDFGVAKLTGSDIQVTTMHTDVGQLIGTVAYMSPEQAAGDPSNIDARSDVYSLGVLTYELLTGQLPYDLSDRLLHEAVRIVLEDEPLRLRSVDRTLRGDVDTIIATAVEKDPSRRYETPAAFASDIACYLANKPIAARPASTWYQLHKFSRRNRALVAGVATSFVMLLSGLIGTTAFAVRADAARRDANAAEQVAFEALSAERVRAQQLEAVAEFQAEQLAELDAMSIGLGIRRGLVEQMSDDARLVGVDFTGLAMSTLEDSLFEPSRRVIDSRFADQPVIRARLLQSLAQSAERVGLLELAESTQRVALTQYLDTLGENDAQTISSSSNLGMLLTLLGRYEEAEQILAATLARGRAQLGDEAEETLACLDNYGLLLSELGRFEEARSFHQEALDTRRALLGDGDKRTLAAFNSMGGVLEFMGRHDEAEPYLRTALEGNRHVLGNDDARTLSSVSNLGVNLKRQGRLDEALPYYEEVIEGRRRTLGSAHPRTVRAMNNMGGLYRALNQPADAVRVYTEALEQYRVSLGEMHPETIIGMNNLGTALRDAGKLDEAEAMGAAAVSAAREAMPAGHWFVGAFLGQHATTLLALERFAEAAANAQEGYDVMLATYGPAHPRTAGAAGLVVSVHNAWHVADPEGGHDRIAARWLERSTPPAAP